MTIRPGLPWGEVGPVPPSVRRVRDDAAFQELLQQHGGSDPGVPIAPVRGDCFRAAGGQVGYDRVATGGDVALLPWDVMEVEADGQHLWAVAHVIARGRSWSGEIVAVMNVDHLGPWDVAPRAHPNDGRLDVVHVDAAMTWRARWQARRRLPQGMHLPHPLIRVRQAQSVNFEFDRPRLLYVDGTEVGRIRHLGVRIHADRVTVCL